MSHVIKCLLIGLYNWLPADNQNVFKVIIITY